MNVHTLGLPRRGRDKSTSAGTGCAPSDVKALAPMQCALTSAAMSEELPIPPLQSGYLRVAVLLKDPSAVTNGDLVRATGVDLDYLGPVLIHGHQASIDVAMSVAEQAREGLAKLGPTQVVTAAPVRYAYRWLRLGVGRNHGLSMGQLRKMLERAKAGPLGRIHVNNTHTLVGVREDFLDAVVEHFTDARTNGAALRPEVLKEGAMKEKPDYKPPGPGRN
jgi:hypothetical protein